MRILCAWCNTTLGEKEPFDEDSISHSVCLKCKDKILRQAVESKVEEKAKHKENKS